jgi:hypothetical protein
LIKGEAKLNILNKPDDERLVSAYNLISAFNNLTFINFKMDSLILTQNEELSLKEMLNLKEVKLVYRASRDGFTGYSFNSKCDGISNTVTIIKTTSNSVFGGFTSATWTSYRYEYTYDSNAFIFSLRRSGNSNKERFNVTRPDSAILCYSTFGPTFGGGYDIYVSDSSNTNEYSSSNLGYSYQLPENTTYGSEEARIYLAGSYNWQTTEIEVYQVTPFLPNSGPYSVSFLHNGCLIIISYYILN